MFFVLNIFDCNRFCFFFQVWGGIFLNHFSPVSEDSYWKLETNPKQKQAHVWAITRINTKKDEPRTNTDGHGLHFFFSALPRFLASFFISLFIILYKDARPRITRINTNYFCPRITQIYTDCFSFFFFQFPMTNDH
jgi:hypothetical protein